MEAAKAESDALVLQAAARALVARKRAVALRGAAIQDQIERQAAMALQSRTRGTQSRLQTNEMHRERREEKAATILQSGVRAGQLLQAAGRAAAAAAAAAAA